MCDSGCHTYPLEPALRDEIIAAMNTFSSNCPSWVRPYLNYELFHQNIRYWDPAPSDTVITADIHLANGRTWDDGQGADYGAQIHVNRPFSMKDRNELADTMAHEAFHGYMNQGPANEGNATALAAICTTTF